MNTSLERLKQSFSPTHVSRGYIAGRAIRKFANSIGLVYFGSVNQVDDEYRLVRGITASSTHRDSHYSVGSFDGYDIAVTIRRDALRYPDNRVRRFEWTIMTVDAHTEYDIPRIFISHDKAREILLAKYTQLTPIIVGIHEPHNPQFTDQYTVSAQIEQAVEVTDFMTPEITNAIQTMFDNIAIEVEDNTVYMYSSHDKPTLAELQHMASNGIWLAQKLDESARRVQDRLRGEVV